MQVSGSDSIIGTMDNMRKQSGKMALCGMMGALAALIMTVGGFIPVATFLSPMIAAACLIPALVEYGASTALVSYAAVAVLALILSPDKESAFLYAFLGWWPVIIPPMSRIRIKWFRILLKLLMFFCITCLAYYLMIAVLGIGDMAQEFREYTIVSLVFLFVAGSVTFYHRLILRYRDEWRQKLWRGHQ